MFHGVSVLLREPTPNQGAMAHAREWAERLNLPLRTMAWPLLPFDLRPLFRPSELCVFDNTLPATFRTTLLERVLPTSNTAAMLCPPAWRPTSRVLILNHHWRAGDGFTATVADVCRTCRLAPVLLTTARSEAEARRREQSAEEMFARSGLTVDCDFAIGCDTAEAAVRVALWRGCSHVFVEHRAESRWRRWLGGDAVRRLAASANAVTIVAVAS